ncbi:hypothetical protein [Streptomyces melanogenes]|uniref:hypothetical protein n=1 Tax=Streptomyces melanogenes TaxID=67326 RepID=UPI0037A0C56E
MTRSRNKDYARQGHYSATTKKAEAHGQKAEAAAARPVADVPAAPVVPAVLASLRPAVVVPVPEPGGVDGDQEHGLVLEELTREQVLDLCAGAVKDPQLPLRAPGVSPAGYGWYGRPERADHACSAAGP